MNKKVLPAHSTGATDCNALCRIESLPNTQSTAENIQVSKLHPLMRVLETCDFLQPIPSPSLLQTLWFFSFRTYKFEHRGILLSEKNSLTSHTYPTELHLRSRVYPSQYAVPCHPRTANILYCKELPYLLFQICTGLDSRTHTYYFRSGHLKKNYHSFFFKNSPWEGS